MRRALMGIYDFNEGVRVRRVVLPPSYWFWIVLDALLIDTGLEDATGHNHE